MMDMDDFYMDDEEREFLLLTSPVGELYNCRALSAREIAVFINSKRCSVGGLDWADVLCEPVNIYNQPFNPKWRTDRAINIYNLLDENYRAEYIKIVSLHYKDWIESGHDDDGFLNDFWDRVKSNFDICLPSELDTERARLYFARAIELGYMERTDTGYKWLFGGNRGLARLGYFVVKIYCPNNTEQLPERAINTLFGVNRIASAITQLHNAKKPQKWRAEIDKIFAD